MVLRLLSFASSTGTRRRRRIKKKKEEEEEEGEHGQFVKCIFAYKTHLI